MTKSFITQGGRHKKLFSAIKTFRAYKFNINELNLWSTILHEYKMMLGCTFLKKTNSSLKILPFLTYLFKLW